MNNTEKKYHIALGIMIFLFVIFIGIIIAWALGYISFNKTNARNEISHINDTDLKDNSTNLDNSQHTTNHITNDTTQNNNSNSSNTNYGLYESSNANDFLTEMAITPRGLCVFSSQTLDIGNITSTSNTEIIANISNTNFTIKLLNPNNISCYFGTGENNKYAMKKNINNGITNSIRTNQKVLPGIYLSDDGIAEFIFLKSNVFIYGAQEVLSGTYSINGNTITLNYKDNALAKDVITINNTENLTFKNGGNASINLKLLK